MWLAVLLTCVVLSVARCDRSDPYGEEGVVRFNKFLDEAANCELHDIPHAEHAIKRKENYNEIGTPSTFALSMHPWKDADLTHGRLIWGQIQDFKSRCGGSYSEDWCLSVVRFIENGIGYRELQLAVLDVHEPHETATRKQKIERDVNEEEDNEYVDPNNTRQVFNKALRNFINMARARK